MVKLVARTIDTDAETVDTRALNHSWLFLEGLNVTAPASCTEHVQNVSSIFIQQIQSLKQY